LCEQRKTKKYHFEQLLFYEIQPDIKVLIFRILSSKQSARYK